MTIVIPEPTVCDGTEVWRLGRPRCAELLDPNTYAHALYSVHDYLSVDPNSAYRLIHVETELVQDNSDTHELIRRHVLRRHYRLAQGESIVPRADVYVEFMGGIDDIGSMHVTMRSGDTVIDIHEGVKCSDTLLNYFPREYLIYLTLTLVMFRSNLKNHCIAYLINPANTRAVLST